MAKNKTANAAYQAEWRARQIQADDGTKERLSLVLERGTKAALERLAKRHGFGSITQLIEFWARSDK